MITFLYNLYIFVWIQQDSLANMVFALDPSGSVIIKLWCSNIQKTELSFIFILY